jgi:ATP adenylyltransferase
VADNALPLQFEIRLAPALAKKPTKNDASEKKSEKPADPFAPPYIPDLYVAEDNVKEEEGDAGDDFIVLVRFLSFFAFLLPLGSGSYTAIRSLTHSSSTYEHRSDRSPCVQLNKFCVTPRHFLLVTKEFVKQTTPLSPAELYASWSILRQLGSREKHLAFLNCGVNSGASCVSPFLFF